MGNIITVSDLTCPECGHKELLEMPTNSCQWFYECTACMTLMKPLKGDCCVFCSYGTVPCPPIQQSGSCSGCGS
ncbi:GDCCVxC domain-containing (seleno)protein [Thalassotalea sp. ND16A]|uniref:GDCCVxC domain-containing (seleno)protein n=1 Tax=Thalassotalea sp. ND16A TaxID=1535422 RepID=UPI0009E09794|nr:GDCCVxC domain-containing (seleno)protein [Thalassotalea sp. ND16A]